MPRYRSYNLRRIIPVALVVLIIIIAIVVLVSLMRAILFPPKSDTGVTPQADITQQALLDTSADRGVRLVVRGPIVADENFRSYRITITPSERRLQTFEGYLNEKIRDVKLPNNTRAYEEFVHALNLANMTKGNQLEGDANDVRGICATGRVSEFSLLKDGASVETLWTSTCRGSTGSLEASVTQLTSLFTSQIPNADQVIREVSL